MSFGISYGIKFMIQTKRFDGSFGIFAALTAAFGLLAVPIYLHLGQAPQIDEQDRAQEKSEP